MEQNGQQDTINNKSNQLISQLIDQLINQSFHIAKI